MFKNCCGCHSKKPNRKESEEDEDEDEKKEKATANPISEEITSNIFEKKCDETAKSIAQIEEVLVESNPDGAEVVQRKPSSLKKPKPRLSISNEIKIIPCNYLDDLGDFPDEEEVELTRGSEQEDEEDEPEDIKITVKDIDGKIIRKSMSAESSRKPSLEGETRTASPLSDEVFVANEKSHLDLPLNNLGVNMEKVLPLGLEVPETSQKKQVPSSSQKRVSMPAVLPKWLSEEDETGGSQEPPATPVARDELALRRHRFFSELLTVAQAATEHRVRFDPFGPTIEILSELDQGSTQSQAKDFENLLNRLEKITLRLEKAIPLIEKGAEAFTGNIVVTESLENLLDEHFSPTEKKNLNLLINSHQPCQDDELKEDLEEKNGFIIISPDSSADFEELSEKDLILNEEELISETDKIQNNISDKSENSTNSQNTVVSRIIDEKENNLIKETKSNELKKEEDFQKVDLIIEKSEMTNSQSTLNMSVQGYQQILQGPFASYLQVSSQIGGDVAEHARFVQEAFQAQLQYLSLAAQSSKPSQAEESKLLQPTSQHIEAIQSYRDKHRTSQYFNHLSAISESIPALGWVTVSPAPAPYVKEMNDAGQFYTNRVLKDWKEKDKIHVEWTKAWVQTLTELQQFVKQYHTTGLVWGGTTAPRVTAAPLPPGGMPPPPPPMFDLGDMAPAPGQDRSALFAEINQGENITRNLKRVTADMQTHKNPTIRAGPAPFKSSSTSITNQAPKPFKAPSPPEKPPKFAREGKKWFIEHQKGNHQLVVENAEMNNVVYVFKCSDSTLVVKGKVNSIFLDSCKKTAVVFDSVVSSIEFVNCQSVQMQVLGMVPTISIDKTDGCQMYLSQDSLNVEIVSSKSSEMNVLVPTGSGDFKEYPIPEQFKTTVSKQGLTTTAVENKG